MAEPIKHFGLDQRNLVAFKPSIKFHENAANYNRNIRERKKNFLPIQVLLEKLLMGRHTIEIMFITFSNSFDISDDDRGVNISQDLLAILFTN